MEHPISLQAMSPEEFKAYRNIANQEYARQSPHYRNLPFEEAILLVEKEFDTKIAPQGLASPGQYFCAITQLGQCLGFLHVGEFPRNSKSLWIWNIRIDESKRGQGVGRRALEQAQIDFKKLGYEKIGLNVFASNHAAIHLYEKLGFQTTQINMELSLS